MFIRQNSPVVSIFCAPFVAGLLLFTGCSDSTNPVGLQTAADQAASQSEQISVDIPAGVFDALQETDASARPAKMAVSGANINAYTFDDLALACHFNTTFSASYEDLEFSDSRLLARCSFDGGIALLPTDLTAFNSGAAARNLITLPSPATEVSIDAFGIRDLGPRNFVAYDASGNEIDRASYENSTEIERLTVTGEIHQVAIIDYQAQTFWDNLTVTYGVSSAPPVADAGPDQEIIVTEIATLVGSGSADSNADALSYAWSWAETPEGSGAVFSHPSSPVTTFGANLPGAYVAQLVVNDGIASSTPDEVVIVSLDLSDAVAKLIGDVLTLREGEVLNGGQSRSLLRMLDVVRQMVDDQPTVAQKKLKAFAGHVSGLVHGGVLTGEQGDTLIEYANRIAAASRSLSRASV